MKSEFKNFGEALAWMMESPENVAVRDGRIRYRVNSGRMEYKEGPLWRKSADHVDEHARYPWSRAPKEPQVFTFEGNVNNDWDNRIEINGTSSKSAIYKALKSFPKGTPVKITLEVG